eukprot:GABV01009220.1.p1 GENE.GABV01009220.1~~GABV01009220.1.p1  ORF type:complete len:134 (-),score=14.57 GABV01009220.1:135-536(-)
MQRLGVGEKTKHQRGEQPHEVKQQPSHRSLQTTQNGCLTTGDEEHAANQQPAEKVETQVLLLGHFHCKRDKRLCQRVALRPCSKSLGLSQIQKHPKFRPLPRGSITIVSPMHIGRVKWLTVAPGHKSRLEFVS